MAVFQNMFKVQNDEGFSGLVPGVNLKEETAEEMKKSGPKERLLEYQRTIRDKQGGIQDKFDRICGDLKSRAKKLGDRLKMSQLVTQASTLKNWMDNKVADISNSLKLQLNKFCVFSKTRKSSIRSWSVK